MGVFVAKLVILVGVGFLLGMVAAGISGLDPKIGVAVFLLFVVCFRKRVFSEETNAQR